MWSHKTFPNQLRHGKLDVHLKHSLLPQPQNIISFLIVVYLFFNQSGLIKVWQVSCLRNVPTAFKRQVTIRLQESGADTPSHISVSLNFEQVESERAPVVLNVDSKRHVLIQVTTEDHTASSGESLTGT